MSRRPIPQERNNVVFYLIVSIVLAVTWLGFQSYIGRDDVLKSILVNLPLATFFVGLVTNAAQVFEKVRNEKIENTLKLLQQWDDPKLLEARTDLRKQDQVPKEGLVAAIGEYTPLSKQLILLFNFWLKIYYAFRTDRINGRLMQYGLKKAYLQFFDRYEVVLKAWYDADERAPFVRLKEDFGG